MKTVVFLASARRSWRALPADVRDRIHAKVRRYMATGDGDVRALSGRIGARLRVGPYRVIVVETAESVEIHAVGHRADIYE